MNENMNPRVRLALVAKIPDERTPDAMETITYDGGRREPLRWFVGSEEGFAADMHVGPGLTVDKIIETYKGIVSHSDGSHGPRDFAIWSGSVCMAIVRADRDEIVDVVRIAEPDPLPLFRGMPLTSVVKISDPGEYELTVRDIGGKRHASLKRITPAPVVVDDGDDDDDGEDPSPLI